MKTEDQKIAEEIFDLAKDARKLIEDIDGRKSFVKDMRTEIFCLFDNLNKFIRREEMEDE